MNFIRHITPFYVNSRVPYLFSVKKSNQQIAYYQHRVQQLKGFQYKHIKPTITVQKFINQYKTLLDKGNQAQKVQILSGRVSSIRKHGKTTFVDIRESHVKVQVALKTATDEQVPFKRGDIVSVKGKAFVTKKGELSLLLQKKDDIQIISPCYWMLPQYNSLKDSELRFRNKHVDLITNHQSVKIILLRSKIIAQLRKQLQKRDFIQVQTPILSDSYGGAIAKPFVTYHNDHKMNLFMRIAPELYLKRLLIGGIPRVFEIGKNFRNQSIDQTHNPQFTSLQLYCAYADYKDMIVLTKQLFCSVVRESLQTNHCRIKIKDKEIDLQGEWKEIDFIGGLQEKTNEKFPEQFSNQQSLTFLKNLILKYNVLCDQPRTAERMLDKLAEHFLQPLSYDTPLFIINQPSIMSPLAKPIKDRPHLTARFQLFIGGWQFVNSYTQLNDPKIQALNSPQEKDFVQALQYGLMPCSGWGLGVDRLIMLLSESKRIQQVIIFPLLRSVKEQQKEEQKQQKK